MCYTVIEVKVTGSAVSPPPSDTDSDTLTTHPALLADERCLLWSGFKGGGSVQVRSAGLHLLMGMQSLQEWWEVTKVILQLQHSPHGSWGIVICWQKPGCVTLNLGCYPEAKSMWTAWLCEKVAVISEPPAYQMPSISPSRWWECRIFQPSLYFWLKKMRQGNFLNMTYTTRRNECTADA